MSKVPKDEDKITRRHFTTMIRNALTACNIKTFGDLRKWGSKKIRGLGEKSRKQIDDFLNGNE